VNFFFLSLSLSLSSPSFCCSFAPISLVSRGEEATTRRGWDERTSWILRQKFIYDNAIYSWIK
jgi:hypothetical protein